jgi:hypothetical protein
MLGSSTDDNSWRTYAPCGRSDRLASVDAHDLDAADRWVEIDDEEVAIDAVAEHRVGTRRR